jgi:hypothetical protein
MSEYSSAAGSDTQTNRLASGSLRLLGIIRTYGLCHFFPGNNLIHVIEEHFLTGFLAINLKPSGFQTLLLRCLPKQVINILMV